MSASLRFTVVVPTFRRPDSLARCLHGLAGQTLPKSDFEVIIVDDSGRRGAVNERAIAAHGLCGRVLYQEHAGPAAARNRGAAKARGRVLAFTDDDCSPAPDWLETAWAHFRRFEDDLLIGGRVVNGIPGDPFASASQALVDYLITYFNPNGRPARLLTSNNLCVPTAPFRQMGGFDTAFQGAGGEDRELCLRWVANGRPSRYVPDATVFHFHEMTLSEFIRQHRAYGRGSAILRRRRIENGYGPLPLEPLSFYVDLLRYPLTSSRRGVCLSQGALFALSQAANGLGFLQVRLKEGMPWFRNRER